MGDCPFCGGSVIVNDDGVELFCMDCGTIIAKDPRTIRLINYSKEQTAEAQRTIRTIIPREIVETAPIRDDEFVFSWCAFKKNIFSPTNFAIVTEEKLVLLINKKLHAVKLEDVVAIHPVEVFHKGQNTMFSVTIETFEGLIAYVADDVIPANVPKVDDDTRRFYTEGQQALDRRLKNSVDAYSALWKTQIHMPEQNDDSVKVAERQDSKTVASSEI